MGRKAKLTRKYSTAINGELVWNYRVMKKNSDGLYSYAIFEVFYENDKVVSFTETSVGIMGEGLADLKKDLEYYIQAFDKPTLDYDDLKTKLERKKNKGKRIEESSEEKIEETKDEL